MLLAVALCCVASVLLQGCGCRGGSSTTTTTSPGLAPAPTPKPPSKPTPVWPEVFSSAFTSPANTGKNTTGLFAVDFSGEAAGLISFNDGFRDHMCRFFGNAHLHTPCSHLMTQGWRYLVWPEFRRCCKCGTYANGYGPISSKWVKNLTGNLVYEGVFTVNLSNSVSYRCHKWDVHGLDDDDNYYYQHVSGGASDVAGKPCEVDGSNYLDDPSQKADDQYIFDMDTYTTNASSKIFEVPSYCSQNTYCGAPHCDAAPSIAV